MLPHYGFATISNSASITMMPVLKSVNGKDKQILVLIYHEDSTPFSPSPLEELAAL